MKIKTLKLKSPQLALGVNTNIVAGSPEFLKHYYKIDLFEDLFDATICDDPQSCDKQIVYFS
jgi:hypothetical protein